MYFEIDDYNALRAALQKMCARFSDEKVPQEIVFDGGGEGIGNRIFRFADEAAAGDAKPVC